MARKKAKSRTSSPASNSAAKSAPAKKAAAADSAPSARRGDVRAYIYLGFDLVMVVLWIVLLSTVFANRHGGARLLLWSMVVFVIVMGAAMLVRNRWGWRSAALSCAALLLMWLVVLVTLLMSAAYLAGVYGAFGRAAAMGTLVVAALSFQLVGLLPAFQLKFLMTRAGRRHFGQEPL
jgi:hypothetical protein